MRKLLFIFLFLPFVMKAQTITAASCSSADVATALSQLSTDGTTQGKIIFPTNASCTTGAAWNPGAFNPGGNGKASVTADGQLAFTQTNPLIIQGNGTVSLDSHGNPVTGSYNDQTIFISNVTGGKSMLSIVPATCKSLQITGISFKGGSTTTTSGQLNVSGNSQSGTCTAPQLRLDHNHFYNQPAQQITCLTGGWIYGVGDHNLFDLGQGQVSNGCRVDMPTYGGSSTESHGSWAAPTNWGGQDWFFLENNTYNYAFASDCANGGKQVYRFNQFNYSNEQSHESGTRGCRATEDYMNWVLGNSSLASNNSHDYLRMGGLLTWGNTASSAVGNMNFIEFHNDRSEDPSVGNHCQVAPPGGLGYAGIGTQNGWHGFVDTNGTAVTLHSGTDFNGPLGPVGPGQCNTSGGSKFQAGSIININGTAYTIASYNSNTSLTLTTSAGTQPNVPYYEQSNWDGNADTSGYPAFDQGGRGQSDLLSSFPPTMCDTVNYGGGSDCTNHLYSGRWPHNALDPVYSWDQTFGTGITPEATGPNTNGALFINTRDFYLQTGSTSVTGGVGQGTIAQRPMTCNAGPGGNTPGEAYWATDVTNPKQSGGPLATGALYVCNPNNTWNLWYQPYTYPHPLVSTSPIVLLSPTSFNYGSVNVGSSSPNTFTLSNTSGNSLASIAFSFTGSNPGDFIVTNSGAGSCAAAGNTLANNASCTFIVSFVPSLGTLESATLNVSYTGGDSASPKTSSLSGTGVGTPTLSVTPSSASCGSVNVGSSLNCQTFTLQNIGTATITGLFQSGGLSDLVNWQITSNICGSTLGAGQSCTFVIAFHPTSNGSFPATLTLISNASNSPSIVNLSGTGVGGVAALSPTSLVFPGTIVGHSSATQTFTFTNNGPGQLTITSITASGDFSQTNTCTIGSAIAVNSNCVFTVTFNPVALGPRTGAVTITTNGQNTPVAESLSGTGLSSITNTIILNGVSILNGAEIE